MGLSEQYVRAMYKESGLWSLYPPLKRLALGDYGTLERGAFTRLGNLDALLPGALLARRSSGRQMHREFKTRRVHKCVLGAGATIKAGVVTTAPSLDLTLGDDFSVYCSVAGCSYWEFEDLDGVLSALTELAAGGSWDADRVVVTSLIDATNLTLVLSAEADSRLVLQAGANTPTLDLADASLSLQVVYDSSSSDQWITARPAPDEPPWTPFFSAHRVKKKLFGGRVAVPAGGPEAAFEGAPATPPPPSAHWVAEPLAPAAEVLDGWRSPGGDRRS